MENKNEKAINRIEKVLNDTELLETQRKTLVAFDRFNDLESGCRLSTRLGYILTVRDLALAFRKPFTGMTREDLQQFIAEQKKRHTPSSVATYETHLKRFFRWLEWVKTNEGKPDEEKVEVKDVKLPYNVRARAEWRKQKLEAIAKARLRGYSERAIFVELKKAGLTNHTANRIMEDAYYCDEIDYEESETPFMDYVKEKEGKK